MYIHQTKIIHLDQILSILFICHSHIKSCIKKSLKYSGSHIWNILPINVKSAPNFICFKRACKQFIVTNIPFNCKLEF